jgi:hypothetical protein
MINFTGVDLPEEVDGRDLLAIITGDGGPKRDYVTCGYGKYVWVKDNRYVYISETTGSDPKLYDLQSDAGNYYNIADDNSAIVKEMYGKAVESGRGQLPKFDYLPSYAGGATPRTAMTDRQQKRK